MSANTSLGKNEALSIGLGLISWVFPNIPTVIKIIITLFVLAIIIFMVMEKQQREKALTSTGNAFEYYIIPGLAGALKFFFYSIIAMFLVSIASMIIFDKVDLFTTANAFDSDPKSSPKGWMLILWSIASHLNTLGVLIAIGSSFFGMIETIKEAKSSYQKK